MKNTGNIRDSHNVPKMARYGRKKKILQEESAITRRTIWKEEYSLVGAVVFMVKL